MSRTIVNVITSPTVADAELAVLVRDGGGGGKVVNVRSAPLAVPALLLPFTRKWYSVLAVNPVIAAETALVAPAATVLGVAAAVLP